MSLREMLIVLTLSALAVPLAAQGTDPTITTMAGTGVFVTEGDGGPAPLASFANPWRLDSDRWGNLFVTDGERVRRIDAVTGIISTVAGGGSTPFPNDGMPATEVQLAGPSGLAVDSDGNLFLGDAGRIRRVDAVTGLISTYAGGSDPTQFLQVPPPDPFPNYALPSGDGGLATDAFIKHVSDMAFDEAGNLYFCDLARVRRIDAQTGIITTVVGNGLPFIYRFQGGGWIVTGIYSGDGGAAVSAGLVYPTAMAFDAVGNLYLYDIDAGPTSDALPALTTRVRRVDAATGIISAFAGTGAGGFSGDGGPATQAQINNGWGLACDRGSNVYLSDTDNIVIRKVDAATDTISTVVGSPQTSGFYGDGGPAAAALLGYPGDIVFDPAGSLFIVDWDNARIRKVTGLSPNTAPTANAGPDASIHAGQWVFLDGSASFDDDTPSPLLGFSWTFGSKPAGSNASLLDSESATPSFFADFPGTYVVRLVVTDEGGLSSALDEVQISSTNLAPAANAGLDLAEIVGSFVMLDGAASDDPESDTLSYQWSLTARPLDSEAVLGGEQTPNAFFVPDVVGTYLVALVVRDGFTDSTPDEVVVTVITGQQFAENTSMQVINEVSALSSSQITNTGNQQAFVSLVSTAIERIQDDKVQQARASLNKALSRTDGCVLRGAPDTNGVARDWITDCNAQQLLYDQIIAALSALE